MLIGTLLRELSGYAHDDIVIIDAGEHGKFRLPYNGNEITVYNDDNNHVIICAEKI